ncbi:S8 family serine peptidase [Flavobacterium sp. ZB4P13]|uniref:S8 family serine peptidase n=1 Tax=Flavobacterium sp. ZB4P13 TaxID=3401728 RepID=UPI003AAF6869
MKKIFFMLFAFQISFSQTNVEREKIKSTYDEKKIVKLKDRFNSDFKFQKNLINAYKSNKLIVDSEKRSLQRIYDGMPIYFTTDNAESGITINANSLYTNGELGLNLSGLGITAGVWDSGKVRSTHQEFNNDRIVLGDNYATLSSHASHVSGTIISAGIDSKSKGIAYKGTAKTFYWDSDISEMAAFGSEGFLVSNHSYGYTLGGLANWRFGAYDQTSADYDMISDVFPYYQIVVAAGNSRNSIHPQIVAKNGFDLLTGSTLSKNCLVVGAVNYVDNYTGPSSVAISSFSNYGPTDDGRIKPDIVAKGVGVYSTTSTSDLSYDGTYNGTSMAAPAITGLILLLQEHYKNLNGVFMKAATVKGLICHTASETGYYNGPDYEYGWGLANGKEAALLISNNGSKSVIKEENLVENTLFSKLITLNTSQPLSISIAWTDPVGTIVSSGIEDSRTSVLVNNLDLKVIKDNVVYYPWKLDVTKPQEQATNNSDNDVDNIEKIFIENAEPGTYTIQVSHKGTLLSGSQNFSLIVNGQTGLTLASSDFEMNDAIKLYPNPTQDVLFFELPQNFTPITIEIYDVLGKQINKVNYLQKNSIKVSDLLSGLYFIKFVGVEKVIDLKFVKK